MDMWIWVDVPSIRTSKASLRMLNVVMSTRNAKKKVQMGSASFQLGYKITVCEKPESVLIILILLFIENQAKTAVYLGTF